MYPSNAMESSEFVEFLRLLSDCVSRDSLVPIVSPIAVVTFAACVIFLKFSRKEPSLLNEFRGVAGVADVLKMSTETNLP